MAVVERDALGDLRARIEGALRRDLSPAHREALFARLRSEAIEMLGLIDRYAADERRAQEAQDMTTALNVQRAWENAALRTELIDRGMATPEEMDALGYISEEELRKLAEEGLLEEAVNYLEAQHPRGRGGKWIDKYGGILKGLPGSSDPTTLQTPPKAKPKPKRAKKPETEKPDEFATKREGLEQRAGEQVRAAGEAGKLTDAEAHFNDAGKVSQRTLARYVDEAKTTPHTVDMYSVVDEDGQRTWDESRRQLHEHIIDRFLRQRVFDPEAGELDDAGQPKGAWVLSSDAPEFASVESPQVLFSGGGYAAGKSSVLKINRAKGGEPPSGYEGPVLVLDPDAIKAELPEFQEMLGTDPEANMHVYQEAWEIAQEVQARAQEKRVNMVVDGISDTSPEEMVARTQSFTSRGYTAKAIYVDIPTEEAMRRAATRAQKAKSDADKRHIPEIIMRSVHRDVAATVPNMVRALSERGIDLEVEVWDNHQGQDETGAFRPPLRFFSFSGGEEQIENADLWQRFQAKAHEEILGVDKPAPTGTGGAEGKAEPPAGALPEIDFEETDDHAAFGEAKNANAKAWNLSAKSEEEYAAAQMFMSGDGKVGFMLDPDGDLQNVFNNKGPKGAGAGAVVHAVEQGANTLDAYDGFLPSYYSKFGFVEVARQKFVDEYAPEGWDFDELGRPDVVHMAFQGDRTTLREQLQRWPESPHEYSPTEEYVDDWDDAKARASQAASAGAG